MQRFLVILTLVFSSVYPAACQAEVHAILVGFNYKPISHLMHGINDAVDISKALKRRGLTDITLLTSESETVAHFRAEWAATLRRAKPGDFLILSFAGPRIIERWEKDGIWASFGFPNDTEVITDDKMYQMLAEAAEKSINILVINDSSYGFRPRQTNLAGQRVPAPPIPHVSVISAQNLRVLPCDRF